MKSKTGKIYKITEYISEDSISYDYTIKGIGFLNSNDSVEILKQFPLFKTLFVDLDFNGFEELYLVTKSVDKGLIVVRGIASYDDKTFGSINVEGSTKSNALFNDVLMLEKPTRLWYLGNDSIFFTIGRIMIKKPIQSLGSNPNFHDTYVSIDYRLILDSIYQLTKVDQNVIQAFKNPAGTGSFKTLVIDQ